MNKPHKLVNGVQVELTDEEIQAIEAEWSFNEKKADKTRYVMDRIAAYPPIGEQLDMLFKAMDAGEMAKDNDFYRAIKAVKDRYPKP